ncbi:coiled-coil domain-containing protein [Psychrobacter sp. 72-O-c]|uniref:coiled-coil domain-containing protein n=1 Tax=Psychrobacter sp. 72-O-c TaxID=2774125 RepID=UPI00191B1AD9|nr:hypothetical protein [Psychrobacter sp. 72-O-c]
MSLVDRLIEPTKNYINFRDFIFHLSSVNNEPLYEVVTYLLHHNLNNIGFYNIDTDYKIIRFDSYEFNSVTEFLEEIQKALSFSAEEWIFNSSESLDELADNDRRKITNTVMKAVQSFLKKSELSSFEPLEGLLHFDSDVNNDVTANLNNNSLASYLTEYNLPQVVALILNIDLSDITVNRNNSYINNKTDYDETYYHKFENLLQSYSIAALNHKPDGINLVARRDEILQGLTRPYADLEETNISRNKLADYLVSIGYKLDKLIAKQKPLHIKDNSYEIESNDLDKPDIYYQKRIAELEQRLADKEADSIFVMSNATVEQAESKANQQVINELREQLENVQTDNNDLSNRLNTVRNTYRLQKIEIDDLKEQLKEVNAGNDQLSQQVDKLADTAQDHLYDWQEMDKNQYPPELHLTIEVWKEYYQADVIKHITQFDTSKFNKIATGHKLINGNLKDRIRTLLTPLDRKTKAPQLMKSLKVIDLIHTDKLEQD